jgi:hypothetical protein
MKNKEKGEIFMTLFTSEVNTVNKYERENIRITDEHIDNVMKWITKRDIDILMLLLSEPYLTISQIEMTIFSDLKPSSWRAKANERIRRLYNSHCIDRFFPNVRKNSGSSEQHIILDYTGAKIIAKVKGYTKFKWRKRTYLPQTYRHYLKIMDFKALLHVLNRQLGVIDGGTVGEIIGFETEQMKKFHYNMDNKVHEGRIIPDAFCIYKYTANERVKTFYLECDNATEPIETIKSKLLNYRRYFASGEWRNEDWARIINRFPAVCFVFHHQEQVDEMVAYARRLNSNLKFLFTTYDKLFIDVKKKYEKQKKYYVLQERKIMILDSIWSSKDGITSL